MEFGNLTYKAKKNNINSENNLDFLFSDSHKKLDRFSVSEEEYKYASENLQKLTQLLQLKRLRLNSKSFCEYFTL